ncbi:MAG TPA: right-handed parallel beta-helix repeat-containing protein [Candidatus Acidoferrales bacterium]|nr:right-handed parallel beta-helix repeat-containing protein [Candidatus Acidoferrales bacterium]
MRLARWGIIAILVLAYGCGDDGESGTGGVTVNPGQSIQAAIDAASPGDTINVMPGDYTESQATLAAIMVTKPLKLIAKSNRPSSKVRILPTGSQHDGILVAPANEGDPDIDGVEISGFTVEGFSNNGIWLRHVKNFTIDNNETINNLENGIWPTLSANGLVKKNVSYGSQDSALWVEGSENVRVMDNELHHSPTGLEITVSNEVTAESNDVHDNTVGVGLYHPAAAGLPPLMPLSLNGYWHIINNHVYNNNQASTAPGGMAAQIPPGGGILVLGVDHVDLQQNHIDGNDFFGIAMIDYCVAVKGSDFDCATNPPEVSDTSPDNNMFIGNVLTGNGLNAPPGSFHDLAADIIGLGGKNNCASGNTATKLVLLPDLPSCS